MTHLSRRTVLRSTACNGGSGAVHVLPLFLGLAFRSLTMPPLETALVLGTYVAGFGSLTVAITVATAFGYAWVPAASPATSTAWYDWLGSCW
ncbi:hypothetical protein [Natrinema sp. J7-2]|uniref:hypothetical protein n=1 Tax=Natrinema sp. (strain J7-2) TaxID=406552 RepID=UPI00026D449B|nr:hypothetical protein [Natrinema sp. J7-2]AFO58306.1 cytochrome c biogenesis protein transmembrane region [Natrinema sp. J7-2]